MAHAVFSLLNINKLSQFNITEHLVVLIFCHWHKKSVSHQKPNSFTKLWFNPVDITCWNKVYGSFVYPLWQSEAGMLSMEHCSLRRRCSLCPIHHELICLSGGLLFSLSCGIYSEMSGWICATQRMELRKLRSRLWRFKRVETNYLHSVISWTCQLKHC